jgi:phage tail P2-like protein
MNKAHGITKENLLASLPAVLANDDNMAALASAVAEVLAARVGEIERVSIYSQIDRLPNELLDILANDFKVDWWDANYTLEEKRNTLKESWRVHRMLGTKAAVETAISAIYPDTQVKEWFEYSGAPYHFKLLIDATYENVDPQKHARVLEKVQFYKNLRSVLDEVEYFDTGGTATAYANAAYAGCSIIDGATAERY